MEPENYKTKTIKKNKKQTKLIDKNIKLKGTALENNLENIDALEETKIYHHPSYYENQIQKSKIKYYEQPLNERYETILQILHNPKLIGLPKNSKIVRTSFVKEQKLQNKIHLLMEANDIFYLISLKKKDTKTTKRKMKNKLKEINNFLIYDYGFKDTRLLYVHGNFKADELTEKGFIPFNYTSHQ